MNFLSSSTILRALLITLIMSSIGVQQLQSAELPKYCESFPAIDDDLDDFRDKFSDKNADEVAYTLCRKAQKVPVAITDIMDHWSGIQKVQYDDRVKQFEEKLRKKVFSAIAASSYPYKNLYNKRDCKKLSNYRGRSFSGEKSACEKDQDFIPKCNKAEYQEILESKENNHHSYREQEAKEALAAEGLQDFSSEQLEEKALNEAFDHLDQQKKLNFMKSHLQNTFLVDKLLDAREQEIERFKKEKTKSSLSCQKACRNSYGPGPGRSQCLECRQKRAEQADSLEHNHELELSRIDVSLGRIYEQSPSLFELEKDFNFSFSNLVSSRFEKSQFAQKLQEKFEKDKPDLLDKMDLEQTQDFISSGQGQKTFAQSAGKVLQSNDLEIEKLGREKTFEERRKKKEALEKLCQGETEGLHHFPGVAESIIAESMQNPSDENDELVKDQAAYCYLLQARPPDEQGGLGVGSVLGASALIAGGVAVQFVPGLGQVAGVGAFGLAAGMVGGGVLAYDSYDRYATSASRYESTQAAYHGSAAWADSTELIDSKDKMMTDAAIAGAEVALLAVDGALVVRPATTLAVKLGRRGIGSSSRKVKHSSQAKNLDKSSKKVVEGEVLEAQKATPDTPSTQVRKGETLDGEYEVVGNSSLEAKPTDQGKSVQSVRQNSRDITSKGKDLDGPNKKKVVEGEVLKAQKPTPDTPSTQVRKGETLDGEYEVVGNSSLEAKPTDQGKSVQPVRQNSRDITSKGKDIDGPNKKKVVEGELLQAQRPTPNTPSTRVRKGETFEGEYEVVDRPSRKITSDSRPKKGASAQRKLQFNFSDRAKVPSSSVRGLSFGQKWGLFGLTGLGTAAFLNYDFGNDTPDPDSDPNPNPGPEPASEPEGDGPGESESEGRPVIKVKLIGDDSISEAIKIGDKNVDIEVEAYIEPEEEELPAGQLEWTCKASDNLCDDVDLAEESSTQTLKLFERLSYSVQVRYVPDDDNGFDNEALKIEGLEYRCETNEDGTQCISDDETLRETASEDDGENLRTPFWWESLPPNAPPPQFKPGPPMKMRTFILPGSI